MILPSADLLELKANPNRNAKGNVIESGIEPGGRMATVLVRKGTLHLGDVIICGQYYGKARALINEEGKRLKEATPSVAVKVLGLNGVPDAGAEFTVVDDERRPRSGGRTHHERSCGQPRSQVQGHARKSFSLHLQQGKTSLKVVVKADMFRGSHRRCAQENRDRQG